MQTMRLCSEIHATFLGVARTWVPSSLSRTSVCLGFGHSRELKLYNMKISMMFSIGLVSVINRPESAKTSKPALINVQVLTSGNLWIGVVLCNLYSIYVLTSLWLERHKMAISFYVCANVHQCLHRQVFLLICFSLLKSLREFISKRITILNKFIA